MPRTRVGIALLRVFLGIVFLAHGSQKLFVFGIAGTTGAFTQMRVPLPALLATLATIFEVFGGIALILGVLTRIGAVLLAIEMFFAIVLVRAKGGFFAPRGAEYELTLFIALVAILLSGPGAYALDEVLAKRRVLRG
ncbi:MAG TPA: DoxX family protein [Gemmatimonadaceae bacterium]|nr:DoxX family protein [Gemmatimonadaceae bacterium]